MRYKVSYKQPFLRYAITLLKTIPQAQQ